MTLEQDWLKNRFQRDRIDLIREGWLLGATHSQIRALDEATSYEDLEGVIEEAEESGNFEFADVIREVIKKTNEVQNLQKKGKKK